MIVTRQKQIPIYWIAVAIAPWAGYGFAGTVMGNTFLFSLKKFVDNPAGLTFILTLPSYVSMVLWPACSFLSDRIWTRIGRRKPFIVASWIGMFTSLLLMPFMPNLWALVGMYMLFMFSNDLGAPLEPLKQEIVPPHQRGMSTAAMSWVGNLAGLLFAYVGVGRFDDVRFLSGHLFEGETLLYFTGVIVLAVTFLILTLAIKEIDPKSPQVGEKLSIKVFFAAILDRDLWPVYILIFGTAMLNSGLGPLGNLLYTDQWNYTKQEMGTNIAVGGIINIFVIGGLAFIADRLPRMKAYQVLITLSLAVQFSYYIYVEYILPDQRPTLIEIIVFGETLSIIGALTAMVYVPLVYDYVVRDKMGTYAAGAGLLNRMTGILTLNLIGFFVTIHAMFFQPPAGEMTRVCFNRDMTQAEVQSILERASWKMPDGSVAPTSQVSAAAWYSAGTVSKTGACWEIRLRDKKSEQTTASLADLQSQLTPILAQEKMLRDESEADRRQSNTNAAAAATDKANTERARIDAINAKTAPLESELAGRGDDFEKQVLAATDRYLLREGHQILAARQQPAVLVNLATTREAGAGLEKSLIELRRMGLNIIDLRRTLSGSTSGVTVSALLDPEVNEEAFIQKAAATVVREANKREANLFPEPPQILGRDRGTALVLDLKVIDEPLENRLSPITSVVHNILAFFDNAQPSEHRLTAMARTLRLAGETEHVSVQAGREKGNVISVTVIVLPQAGQSLVHDKITQRLQDLLGTSVTPKTLAQTRSFFDRVAAAASEQRITVQQPVLAHGYIGMRYDYMSGYIPIFILALIGLAITFAFGRWERNGQIRKLGAEEAAAS